VPPPQHARAGVGATLRLREPSGSRACGDAAPDRVPISSTSNAAASAALPSFATSRSFAPITIPIAFASGRFDSESGTPCGLVKKYPGWRGTAHGRDRLNRHVSRRFCHRARCAAYITRRRAILATPSVLVRTRRRRAVSDNISAFATQCGL